MALIKFELKEEHIKLLKHLRWAIDTTNSIYAETENETPYGGLSLVEDAGVILYGQPKGEFDPLSPYGPQYTEEQQNEIMSIFDELPRALDIITFHLPNATEMGHYKTKWHQRDWRKFTPKD
jgi:hypothetical protein